MTTPCIEAAHRDPAPFGYFRVLVEGRRVMAHRHAWEQAHGPIPAGLCVLHRCDNPPCINVDHLFLGTRADNNRDKWAKGRGVVPRLHGEAHGQAKLTAVEVTEIRKLLGTLTMAEIARRFGVADMTVSDIRRGKTWTHA